MTDGENNAPVDDGIGAVEGSPLGLLVGIPGLSSELGAVPGAVAIGEELDTSIKVSVIVDGPDGPVRMLVKVVVDS